jgi:mRNA interferase RelE/StbE
MSPPLWIQKAKRQTGIQNGVIDYRLIYDIVDTELIVEIVALGHRSDIYE